MTSTRLASAIVLCALLLVACGRAESPTVRFEPDGAPLTAIGADELAAATDTSPVADARSEDAPALRSVMLDQLRAQGVAGSRAAQLLTDGFPKVTASVPLLVRMCSFEGTSAVVAVEAFGDPDGKIVHRRLWVFSATSGNVIRAASFR